MYSCVNFCIVARESECFYFLKCWLVHSAILAQKKNFFFLAPEKIIHEKLEEEIEMEVKGTVTNNVTLNK